MMVMMMSQARKLNPNSSTEPDQALPVTHLARITESISLGNEGRNLPNSAGASMAKSHTAERGIRHITPHEASDEVNRGIA